jgi:hypothetical protein
MLPLLFFAVLASSASRKAATVSSARVCDVKQSVDQTGLSPSVPHKPLSFLENRCQWPSGVLFLARAPNMIVRAERDAIVLQMSDPCGDAALQALVRIEMTGDHSAAEPLGEFPQPGEHHYLMGNDPSKWTTHVRAFQRVRYPCVAEGVDLVLRDGGGHLEYDVEVEPGANLDGLILACEGIERVEIEADGSLLIHTALGALRQSPPKSEELLPDGERRELEVRFRLVDETHFGFEAVQRDLRLGLRIDPGLLWSTYLGSSGSLGGSESATASAVDATGCVTLAGWANGYDFPTTPGAYVATPPGGSVVFVTKLDPTGNLVYSSTIGAHGGGAKANALALDALGRATVGGELSNGTLFVSNFPTTPGAFDTVMSSGNTSGFALRLSAFGDSLVFSTFIEGTGDGSKVLALDVAASDSIVVGGYTLSPAFPVTPGALDTTYSPLQEGFVTRLDPTGSFLEWSTFLGGSNDEAVTSLKADSSDQVTVVGFTRSQNFPFSVGAFNHTVPLGGGTFITRLNAQGNALLWSTFLGGTSDNGSNIATATALAIEPNGNVVLVGTCTDPTFPTTPGALFQAFPPGAATHSFVARVNSTGSSLLYSTLLSFAAVATDIIVDSSGVATVSGIDLNTTMPTTPGAYNATHMYFVDAFLARLNPTGTRLYYSTMFGGPGFDGGRTLAAIGAHRMVLAGDASPGLPTTPGAFDQTYNGGNNDCFAAVLDLYLQGTSGYGTSTPSCHGDLTMNVTQMPAAGAQGFGFYCSGAPPLAEGWLVLGLEAPAPTLVQGASVWLDPSHRLIRRRVQSNADGFVETPMPLTSAHSGQHFAAQYVFANTASCSGPGGFSASHAVLVDVQ